MAMQWDAKFEVGHERIDFEHRIFLDLIQVVSSASGDRERVVRLLHEVEKYAEFHFLSEENLMIDTNYPELETHRLEHRRLIVTLQDKVGQFESGYVDLNDLIDFMYQWFALHTTQVDMKLAQYISAQAEA